jgi:hypothetical protein
VAPRLLSSGLVPCVPGHARSRGLRSSRSPGVLGAGAAADRALGGRVTRAARRRAARGAKNSKVRIGWTPETYAVVDRRRRSLDQVAKDPLVTVFAVAAGGAPTMLADRSLQALFDAGRPIVFLFERREDHLFVEAVRDAQLAASPVAGSA